MRCPFCDHSTTSVVRTEDNARRRSCPKCFRRWNTLEVMEADAKRIERLRQTVSELHAELSGESV